MLRVLLLFIPLSVFGAEDILEPFLKEAEARGAFEVQKEKPLQDKKKEKKRLDNKEKTLGDHASIIQASFSYKDKITRDERARWGEAGSLDMDSDTDIERLKRREVSKNEAYQSIEESKQKRHHYRDVQKEDVWSNPELLENLNNPEEVFTKTFEDCRSEPVYKTTFERSLHSCREGVPKTLHTCTRYLKQANLVQKRLEYHYTNFRAYGEWKQTRNLSNWHQYQKIRGLLERKHKRRPRGFTRFPKSGDTRLDCLAEGRYTWYCGCNHWPIDVKHYYKPQKRDVSIDPRGALTYGPWVNITREEYDSDESIQLEDMWVSNCDALLEKERLGLCRKIERKCTGDTKTRSVEDLDFTRDCWQEEYVYECKSEVDDTCAPLRERGCYQKSSKCLDYRGPQCVAFDVEMECLKPLKEDTGETRLVCGGGPLLYEWVLPHV